VSDPLAQFSAWYEHAVAAGLPEPEAMALATATPNQSLINI
jgi:pyridoxamine 5'-phosphate oxidase